MACGNFATKGRASNPGVNLAGESGQVLKRLNTWKEEVGAAPYGRKSGQALYLSSDWSLRNCKVKCAILGTDHRIMLIAQLVKIRIVCPNVLHKLELADEACTDDKRCNTAIGAVLRRAFRQRRSICGSTADYFAPLEAPHGRIARIHPANM
jgi:hypothetical protein